MEIPSRYSISCDNPPSTCLLTPSLLTLPTNSPLQPRSPSPAPLLATSSAQQRPRAPDSARGTGLRHEPRPHPLHLSMHFNVSTAEAPSTRLSEAAEAAGVPTTELAAAAAAAVPAPLSAVAMSVAANPAPVASAAGHAAHQVAHAAVNIHHHPQHTSVPTTALPLHPAVPAPQYEEAYYEDIEREPALTFRERVSDFVQDNQTVINTFCAGGLAGAASRTAVAPLERLKIIL